MTIAETLIQKGKQQGIVEGRVEGRVEERQLLVRNLYSSGFGAEEISTMLKLDLMDVEQLIQPSAS